MHVLQIMIPISLYATLEIVKSSQVYFIQEDKEMFHEDTNTKPVCRALNITEDLGQVQHIFSDKTGTLTENKMEFKSCSIGNMLFKEKVNISIDDNAQVTYEPTFDTKSLSAAANSSPDPLLSDEKRAEINEFLIMLATCNTVVVSSHSHNEPSVALDRKGSVETLDTLEESTMATSEGLGASSNRSSNLLTISGSPNGKDVPLTTFKTKNPIKKMIKNIRRSFAPEESSNLSVAGTGEAAVLSKAVLKSRYEAESPDELALVKAVCNHGCRLTSRNSEFVSVYLPASGNLNFKVLAILPFDSVRKCMSIVLRKETDGEIVLYTKGADNVIFEKIKNDEINQALMKSTRMFVTHFAKDGLRTLCMGRRVLTESQFQDWYDRFTNCDIENHDAEHQRLCSELEVNLDLLGSTGIEDKLQEGVAESITAFQIAGIKVWVLTGDKQETAINIGYSCGLLPPAAAVLTINVAHADEVESVLQTHLQSVESTTEAHFVPRCLVIDGTTLSHIFTKNKAKLFLKLAEECLSVLCCRTTPSQKAQIVELVKNETKKLCLSIGDGANDVNMIRTANVGVGITGLEGRQASMAADFSIGRFRHLVRLLFVHGHWTYDRLAVMVLYNFFKNSNLIFTLFWYQIYCMFSGMNQIDQVYLIVFHLLFTSLPPIVLGLFDKDLPEHILWKYPRLYMQGPQGLLYHRYSFWLQILDSLFQSLVVFFVSYMHYYKTDIDIWGFGTIQTISLLCSQLVCCMLETRTWHWPYIGSMILTIAVFWAFMVSFGAVCVLCDPPSNPYWVTEKMLETAGAWLCIVLSTVIAVLPRITFTVFNNSIYPRDVIKVRTLYYHKKDSGSALFAPEGLYRRTDSRNIYLDQSSLGISTTSQQTLVSVAT